MKTQYTIWLIQLVLILMACSPNQNIETYTAVTKQGASKFLKAIELAASKPNCRSLLVSVDNEVVLEKYFRPYGKDSLDHLRSATKSIMTTLIGIAIDKGFIASVDVPIAKYVAVPSSNKEKITIKHLMSMTSGLEWDEGLGYNDNNEMMDSGHPVRYVLDNPLKHQPGSTWNYSTGDIHLLSAILTEATGESTLSFARTHLFEPLDIEEVELQRFGDGYYSGGSRLEMKPLDMIKIGQLYANGGMYEDQRLISKDFIEKATSLQNPKGAFKNSEEGYGYGWWVGKPMGMKAYMASGYAGQTIAVVPELKLAMVVTQEWVVNGQKAIQQQDDAQEMAKWVVEAVMNRESK
mgnify:FL=1